MVDVNVVAHHSFASRGTQSQAKHISARTDLGGRHKYRMRWRFLSYDVALLGDSCTYETSNVATKLGQERQAAHGARLGLGHLRLGVNAERKVSIS
jgi:hypothetical protein